MILGNLTPVPSGGATGQAQITQIDGKEKRYKTKVIGGAEDLGLSAED